jgi:predicted nucleic acid-binding Zn ribbon protein
MGAWMPDDKRSRGAERLGDALSSYLRESGLGARLNQADIIEQWNELVGPDVAAVTRAVSISSDGTLFAVAKTTSWLNELSFMEAELLESLNRVTGSKPVRRIRWALMR